MTTAGQPGEAKMEREPFTGPFTRKGNRLYRGDGQQIAVVMSAAEGDWILSRLSATPPGAAGQAVGDLTFDERTAVGIAKESARYTRWFIDVAHGAARGSKICQDADSIIALIAIIDRLIASHAAPLPGYAEGIEAAMTELQKRIDYHDINWAEADGCDMPESARHHEHMLNELHLLESAIRTLSPLPEPAAVEKMARGMPLVCGKCGSHNWEQIAVSQNLENGETVRRYRCRPCGNEWDRAALHGEG